MNSVKWWNELDVWIRALAQGESKSALVHLLDYKRENGKLNLLITDGVIAICAKVPDQMNTQTIRPNTRIIITGCVIEGNSVQGEYATWVSDAQDKSFGSNAKMFQWNSLQINDDNKLIELMKRHNIDSTGQVCSLSKQTVHFINATDNIIQNYMANENNSFLMNKIYTNIENEKPQDIKQILMELIELHFINGKFIVATLVASMIRNDLFGIGMRHIACELLMYLNDGYMIERCSGSFFQISKKKGSRHPIFHLMGCDQFVLFTEYFSPENNLRMMIKIFEKMTTFEMLENHHVFVSSQNKFSRQTYKNKNIYGPNICWKRMMERTIINTIDNKKPVKSAREIFSHKIMSISIKDADINLWSLYLSTCCGEYYKITADELQYFICVMKEYYCNDVSKDEKIKSNEEVYSNMIQAFEGLKCSLKRIAFKPMVEGQNIVNVCLNVLKIVLNVLNHQFTQYRNYNQVFIQEYVIPLIVVLLQVYDGLLLKSKSQIVCDSLLKTQKFSNAEFTLSIAIMQLSMQIYTGIKMQFYPKMEYPELNIICINVWIHSLHSKMPTIIQQAAILIAHQVAQQETQRTQINPFKFLQKLRNRAVSERNKNYKCHSYNIQENTQENTQENKENKNEDNDENDYEMENLQNNESESESETETEYETELEKELAKCGYSMTLAPIGIGASCNVYRISDKNVISYAAKVIDKCVTDYKNNDDKDNGYIQKKQKKRDDLIERERYFFSIFKQNPNDHILKCIDIIETEENVIFIYEYANGRDLHMYMDDKLNEGVYPFCLDDVRNIMKQAILGVMSMHQNGIIHKDLKLSNLFVFIKNNKELRIKIGDFGLCEKIEIKDSKYKNITLSAYCGTKYYWPPEIIKHENYDKKADIWTLGIICYQLLFAKYPFASDQDSIEKAFNNIQHPKPILSYYDQSIGSAIAFCKQCLVKDPKERKNICQSMKHDFFNDKLNDNKCFV
eukprot:533673_1